MAPESTVEDFTGGSRWNPEHRGELYPRRDTSGLISILSALVNVKISRDWSEGRKSASCARRIYRKGGRGKGETWPKLSVAGKTGITPGKSGESLARDIYRQQVAPRAQSKSPRCEFNWPNSLIPRPRVCLAARFTRKRDNLVYLVLSLSLSLSRNTLILLQTGRAKRTSRESVASTAGKKNVNLFLFVARRTSGGRAFSGRERPYRKS